MLHRSSSGREFWWNQLPCGPVLTPISCTKLKIHSAHADSPIVPKQVCFLTYAGNLEEGLVYTLLIKKLRKRCLHLSPVQSSRSIWCMQTVQLFLDKCALYLCWQFGCGPSLCFTDQETQEEMFGWNYLPCGPVLTAISCKKLKIHLTHADSSIVPKQSFLYFVSAIWIQRQPLLHRSRNSGTCFLVEPAKLWTSSNTHLLYKRSRPSYFRPHLISGVFL